MRALRHWLMARRHLVFGLVVLTLAVRALLPQGYMPVRLGQILTIQVCADASGQHLTAHIAVPAASHDQDGGPGHHPVCAFAAHGMPLLDSAAAPLVLAALQFAMVMALLPVAPVRLVRPVRLLPPLRAPPLRF
ncbi:hypothetical protein ACFOOT_10345 [Novosphingobium pokkalii]|uniref:DUF2946 domain-containing protein n=2 Tax=Novosphingobium pokkalii TaxID=1770194 RepID=A0ABV7V342_9SPHN